MFICNSCCGEVDIQTGRCESCKTIVQVEDGIPVFSPELARDHEKYFPDEDFDELFATEANCFWFTGRNDVIKWLVKRFGEKIRNFIEVGCGTGFVTSSLARKFSTPVFYGLDVSMKALAYAKSRIPDAIFVQGDALHLPFNSGFDAVGLFDVVEHIEDDDTVFGEIHRVLNNDGKIFVTVPQYQWLWSDSDVRAMHKRRYSKKELKKKITKAGFEVLDIGSFVSLPFPALLLAKLRTRFRELLKKNSPVAPEIKIPAILNRIFTFITNIENKMLFSGISFPFGGSLYCVASKI